MEEDRRPIRVLPATGIVTLEGLANFIDMGEVALQAALERMEIPILRLGKGYTHKLIRLEDLKARFS